MTYHKQNGVPAFESHEFSPRCAPYVLLIPIINEGNRIIRELEKALSHNLHTGVDIVLCDGGSTDGCTEPERLKKLHVNTLLVKKSDGKQGAQLRMGFWWAMKRGYKGVVTIDGNNKDSIEDVPAFLSLLEKGYDFIQGSRFIKGGRAIHTPLIRLVSVKCLHAPLISLTAKHRFTDTTNNFRGYSMAYLTNPDVMPLRDIFSGYELLAYLSVRASQLGLKVCETPVTRAYPPKGKTPTKISFFKGNFQLLSILFKNAAGAYNPKGK